MAALLVGLSFVMGPVQLLKLYVVPYLVSDFSSLIVVNCFFIFNNRLYDIRQCVEMVLLCAVKDLNDVLV